MIFVLCAAFHPLIASSPSQPVPAGKKQIIYLQRSTSFRLLTNQCTQSRGSPTVSIIQRAHSQMSFYNNSSQTGLLTPHKAILPYLAFYLPHLPPSYLCPGVFSPEKTTSSLKLQLCPKRHISILLLTMNLFIKHRCNSKRYSYEIDGFKVVMIHNLIHFKRVQVRHEFNL